MNTKLLKANYTFKPNQLFAGKLKFSRKINRPTQPVSMDL